MATLEINTENGWDDMSQQIRDMETQELLDLYDLFETNPTAFTTVANELKFRRRHETKLEYKDQVEEIKRRFR